MPVDVDVQARIGTITLNRPDALNAIDAEMRAGLHRAWRRIATDDEILVAIVTGAGDRAFCAGTDLKNASPPGHPSGHDDHLLAGLDTDKPIVCAINGHAAGAGLEIALACDIRIAAAGAKLGLPEVKVGSIPGAGGTQLLPRTVGRSIAMQMLLTGELVDAQTALTWGLVSEVHEVSLVRKRAADLAAQIASNAPLSVRAVKRLVEQGMELPLETALDTERQEFLRIRETEDRAEGRAAFREKRPPGFQGR